jgi:hypothetical protein
MRNAMLAAMAAVTIGTGAAAQVGAPAAAPMQPGGWGASGWQSGQGYAAPVPPAQPFAQTQAAPSLPYDGYEPAYAQAPSPARRPYKPILVGKKLPDGYADPIYTVHDWRAYGLEQPYQGTRWIRYFDDAVLADAHGRAIIVRPIDWNAPRRHRPAPPAMASGWTPPVASTHTERHGDTVVTTQVIPPPRANYGGGYGQDYGWGPGVTVTPSIVTTTTTTVTEPAPRATRSRRVRRR